MHQFTIEVIMFFKRSNPHVTPQDLQKVIQNLNAQRELTERQLKEGSISQKTGQEEMQRLSSLIGAYQNNLMAALDDQQNINCPK
ncbi:Uncharacterised protein [Legionella pneumophila]|uniref:Uncharacterized protein n=2 Tax=Legionella pneumophila TaxID=446 RepID=A0A378K707_LEGPN|nr:hypothetical protein LpnH3D14_02048 [Legionella pneumophila]CZH53843.1 Uncharacterised protein [Legionella pneumophila]CZH87528.1 Uncharacterised protein [Legionella pneumophila]CZI46780.1 Uncharacterised protein [Legionella pneumophila]CZI70079.1 Uncharacterised protein [Legionella pneumophila]